MSAKHHNKKLCLSPTRCSEMVNPNVSMTNGTPLSNGFRNPVVVLDRREVETFKRKSLCFVEDPDSDESNDSEEKKRRYHERLNRSRGHNSPAIASTPVRRLGAAPATGGQSQMTGAQLKDHYAMTIKLAANNKINAKNAFGLHLIDYMSDLIKNSQDGETINFKLASSALDAGAKIYSHRVDCVHSEAQKVASGLVMALDKQAPSHGQVVNEPEEDGEKSGSDNENEEPKPKRKRATRKNVVNIAKDIESLNIAKLESNIEIDPIFYQLSAAFDLGSVNSFLMYYLKPDPSGLLMLDPQLKADRPFSEDSSLHQHSSLNQLSGYLQDSLKHAAQICPKLSSFEFTNRDGAINIAGLEQFNDKNDGFTFDLDADVEDIDENECPDDDGHYSDQSDNDSDGQGINHKSLSRAVSFIAIKDLANLLSDKPTDYNYFNPKLIGAWAGPNHWKRNPLLGLRNKKIDAENKTRNKRKKYEEINFFAELTNLENLDKFGKQELKLKMTTLQKWHTNHNDLQLPEDHGFDPKCLARSFTKPETTFQCAKSNDEIVDAPINDKDDSFEAPDSPGNNHYDDDDDEFPNTGDFNLQSQADPDPANPNPTDQLFFDGENLVDQPYEISNINLPYAKIAKKMDVKKLKRAMWDVLTVPVPSQPAVASPTVTQPKTMNNTLKFSDLYQTLPKKITPMMATNLSAPIAFVTLLHLCNERGLQLEGREDFKDFIIDQPADDC